MTIPGVGPRTAEAVLAYTDDVNRFKRGSPRLETLFLTGQAILCLFWFGAEAG